MVDYSLPMKDMIKLKSKCKELIWIDHHKSAIEAYESQNEEIKGLRINGNAGCECTWKWFSMQDIPRCIGLVADFDVWPIISYSKLDKNYNKGKI